MKHIRSHLPKRDKNESADRKTERGELMRYFCDCLNASRKKDGLPSLTMPRMGRILEGIPTRDLYYLRSVCEKSENFSRKFWWELKHNPANEGK